MVPDDGTGLLVSVLFCWVGEGNVLSCATVGNALAATGGRTKSGGGRVTPGITPGRVRGGRPVEHNTNTSTFTLHYI